MKKILALALAMLMVLCLAACGGSKEAPAEVAPESIMEEVPAAPAGEAAVDTAPAAEGDASGEMGASGEMSASGEMASGEMASGEMGASAEQVATTADFDIEVNGVTGTAHYEDTDNGDEATKGFVITFDGATIEGAIDKGVWTASSGDAGEQAVVDAVQAAFEGSNDVGNG